MAVTPTAPFLRLGLWSDPVRVITSFPSHSIPPLPSANALARHVPLSGGVDKTFFLEDSGPLSVLLSWIVVFLITVITDPVSNKACPESLSYSCLPPLCSNNSPLKATSPSKTDPGSGAVDRGYFRDQIQRI